MAELLTAQLTILGVVAAAIVLGGLVGAEREAADKPAGLRTHMLVAGSAALLVSLGEAVIAEYGANAGGSFIRADPIRILEAVITGVAFLGAGTIIRPANRSAVEGLTTAASLLFVAGIGVTVALRQWFLAVGVTVLALVVLRAVDRLEARWSERRG